MKNIYEDVVGEYLKMEGGNFIQWFEGLSPIRQELLLLFIR